MAETLRVLVVDDEEGIRAGCARALERHAMKLAEAEGAEVRFVVEQAGSAEEGLAKIEAGPPDLLFLDQRLPGLSGLEALTRLPALAPHLLTVMITAYATLDTAVLATKRGAFDFLAKPFTPEELHAVALKAARHVVLQRQARQHAEERRRIRFEFVSVLAHELKSPLNAIESQLLTLREGTLGPELSSYAPIVERSLVRLDGMRKLVVDLLDLTRIESGQRKRDLEEVDVVDAARADLEALRIQAAPRRIALTFRAAGPVRMMADRWEVDLVVSNLLTNAIKYNHDGGRAELEIEVRAGRVVIRVIDTGIGMTQEEAGRVFREFVRIKNEKTRLIPGSGLGLSTVRKVAQLYEGDATVRSEPELGTTVEVVLGPAIPASVPGSGDTSHAAECRNSPPLLGV